MAGSREKDRAGGSSLRPPRERRQRGTPKSTIGRPRALTDRQVGIILLEHARFLAWKALRKTVRSQRQLAQALGVSQATVSLAIRLGGHYKQASPARRAAELKRRREKLARMRARGLL
jgi:predicted DNA-binding protein (UPF0251 family)